MRMHLFPRHESILSFGAIIPAGAQCSDDQFPGKWIVIVNKDVSVWSLLHAVGDLNNVSSLGFPTTVSNRNSQFEEAAAFEPANLMCVGDWKLAFSGRIFRARESNV